MSTNACGPSGATASGSPVHLSGMVKCEGGVCVYDDGPVIRAENVSVSYGRKPALRSVNLDIAPCQITALIGPSGCGKTTLLSCINRLTELTEGCRVEGAVWYGKTNVLDPGTDILALRRKIGMVFQKPNPFPLSIWKNIDLPLQHHGLGDRHERAVVIEGVLKDVGLWDEVRDRLHTPAQGLSGGQQQRLCVARTLALRPDVILFDEPCSALDPLSSQVMEELIASLRSRVTVVIVTHNLAQARRIADSVAVFWVMDGIGQLIEHGPAAQLFAAPQHPRTHAYLSGYVG